MQDSQQSDGVKIFCQASRQQRLIAAIIFMVVAGLFTLLHLAATDRIDVGRWLTPCGMKQRWGLPCPTCEMTTSALAFAHGQILQSFYIQPAAAVLCSILVIAAFLAFFTAVFGVYFCFLGRFFAGVKARYIVLSLLVIIAVGWMVTLVRTLTAGSRS